MLSSCSCRSLKRSDKMEETSTTLLETRIAGSTTDIESTNYDESDDRATAVLVFSTLIAVCGSYEFGAAIGYSSPAEDGIMNELGLTVAEYSFFGSILTIGAILGAVTSGTVADYIGRRGAMSVSQLFCASGWITIGFAKGAWSLDIGRLLVGCGIGLISYVVPVYIAEITPKNLRGRFTSAHQVMITVSGCMMYFIATVVDWRILSLLGIVPCVVQLISLFFTPESPRWLAKAGQEKLCEASLQRLRGENADISIEAAEIRHSIEILRNIPEGRILDLFQKIYARSLLVGIGLMLFQQFGGSNGIFFYAYSIFEDAGFPAKIGTIASSVAQVPTVLFALFLMDRWGRKLLLMISAAGTSVGCFLVGFAFLLEDKELLENVAPSLVFIGMLLFNASFVFGLAGIPWLIMSEIFPINMKGSAGSLISLTNWFSAWIIAYIFNFLMELSSAGTFFLFAVISGFTILFVLKLVPETKGRTLEEIQADMNPISA